MIRAKPTRALEFRLRGRVQGVGFRPAVWRLARNLGLAGEILNDGKGVLLRVGGDEGRIAALLEGIERNLPPLARIDGIERRDYAGALPDDFRISESAGGGAHTQIAPDAAICPACSADSSERDNRRFRYPFTTCTHCGPRLSIVTGIPYDRVTTTMAAFPLCGFCRAEYGNPEDRRFHAEAIACPSCGPRADLVALGAAAQPNADASDAIARAAALIRDGEIVAIKGLGGYHLACDASNARAVGRLRHAKRRDAKPFALMARDLDVIRTYCALSALEERELSSPRAPIVLLRIRASSSLPEAIAPGLGSLGFMLPTTPLHHLLMQEFSVPLVMTSGNVSDDPAVIDDAEVRSRLAGIAGFAIMHDRAIANRVDDSVVHVMDAKPRVLRRSRGFAPAPIDLPSGFSNAPELLAMGGELKAAFGLVKDGQAILSQHQGDLENALTYQDFRNNLALYRRLFDHRPQAFAIDCHPDYLSSKLGRAEATRLALPLIEVQHHHAHVAACLAENHYRLDAPSVLGIAFDGLGFGGDGTLWGGEFLLADYCTYERMAALKSVAMPGGAQAAREPWRNLYAQLMAALGSDGIAKHCSDLDFYAFLASKPRGLIDAMIARGINTPLASSCGRLFDAVAAALGLCRERQAYEGEAAARLEALADDGRRSAGETGGAYPFGLSRRPRDGLLEIDPLAMWEALLDDLARGVPARTMAVRFHFGLAQAIVQMALRLAGRDGQKARFDTVALSGGSFQNRILFEAVAGSLRDAGFVVLAHAEVPTNDGGLALGQAAVAAARLINTTVPASERFQPCV